MASEDGDSGYDSSFINDSSPVRHKRKRGVVLSSTSGGESACSESSQEEIEESEGSARGSIHPPPPSPSSVAPPKRRRRPAVRFIVYKSAEGALCGAEVRGERARCLVTGNVFVPDAASTKPAPLVLPAIRALRKRGEPVDKVFVPARNILFPGFKRVIKSVRQSGELVYGNPVSDAVVDAIRPIAVAVYDGTHVSAGGLRAQNEALQKKCAVLETQNAELMAERDSLRLSLEAIA